MNGPVQAGLFGEPQTVRDQRRERRVRRIAGGEFLPTPEWFVDLAAPYIELVGRRLLDVGAGKGALARRLERHAGPLPMRVTALEQNPALAETLPARWNIVVADLFQWGPRAEAAGEQWDVLVTNPRFSRWYDWMDRCMPLAPEVWAVIPWEMVSRHRDFWRDHPVRRVLVTDRRPWPANVREACWVQFLRGWEGPAELVWGSAPQGKGAEG